MKRLILVAALVLLAGAVLTGAAAQTEYTGLALNPDDLAKIGEINSAAPWQEGTLLGSSTGIYFYPGHSTNFVTLQLPQVEGSQPAALTAVLTQGERAYALSLPAGCLWEVLWDGVSLSLDAPRRFETQGFQITGGQGPARTWVPQQVLLAGDTLCVLSRRMQELGGSVLILVDLQTGQTRAFPQAAGQMIYHLSPFHEGRLLALVHAGGAGRIMELDLKQGSQTPYAQLTSDIRLGEAAILYHPGEDALYIKCGNRLLRRSADGRVKEAAFLNVEAGFFIRFGRLTLLGPDRFAAAHPGGLAVGKLSAASAKPLVLWNVDARDPAHLSAMGSLGGIPLRVEQLGIVELNRRLAEVLVGGLAEPDIFLVASDEVDLNRLMAKGYALNLDSDSELADFAGAAYPQMQALCFHDGQLFLLPVGLRHEGLRVNPAAFAAMNIPVPGSLSGLIHLAEAWPDLSVGREEHALFTHGTPRGRLVDALWSTWLADSARQGAALNLEDPGFKGLMTAIDQAALTGWPRRQQAPDAVHLFPHHLDEAFDLKRWTSFLNWEAAGQGAAAFANFPLPLAVHEDSPPVLPVRLMLLGINPRSTQKEAALLYLKQYLKAMPVEQRMLLCPQMNQPVSNPQLPLMIQRAEEALEQALKAQEQAAPDADHHALKKAVNQAQQQLAYWCSDPPLVSREAIQAYRDLMAQAVVMTYQGAGGHARDSLEPLIARFGMGTIGIDELIREGSSVLRLSSLEDE